MSSESETSARAASASLLSTKLESGRTVEEELRQFRMLAKLLDTQFSVLGVKFGIDSLIGLVPVAGDVMTGVVGLYALHTAHKLELRGVKGKIIGNLVFDTTIGAIPIIGDIIDFFFPAHARNFRIIEKHLAKRMAAQERDQV